MTPQRSSLRSRLASLATFVVLTALLLPGAAWAEGAKAVPKVLEPWTAWALAGKEAQLCPTLEGGSGETRCIWPSQLELALDDTRGAFTQSWHVETKTFVSLPGDDKRWPQSVTVDGKPGVVVPRGGAPSVELDAGDHVLKGTFAWDSLPESLRIPQETGLLALTSRGKPVALPQRDEAGTVWLQRTTPADEGERLDVVVHRKIEDQVPLLLTTRVVLSVAGKSREVLLGKALPKGFTPMSVDSQLPVRVEEGSRMRVQVRPGTWTIELVARSEGPVSELTRPAPEGPWREGEEVWVFDARPELRLVDVEGSGAIDPQQTSLPDAWKKLPAYPMPLGTTLHLVERRRGDQDPQRDPLTLVRTLWLDFDGRGLTASDVVTGTLRRPARLEMPAPSELGRVSLGGRDQFITKIGEKNGVELPQGALELSADSRIEASPSDMPVVSWDQDFHSVSATLHLPAGYRLLHASGVDDVPSTWIKHFTLLELFLVLVLSIAVFRLYGPAWGALAIVTLVLVFPEEGAPKYVFVAVLVTEALVRAIARLKPKDDEAPSKGLARARVLASVLRAACAALLVLLTVPFLVGHVRQGLFPALASSAGFDEEPGNFEGGFGARAMDEAAAVAPAAPPAMEGGDIAQDAPVDAVQQQDAKLAEKSKAPPKPQKPAPAGSAWGGRANSASSGSLSSYAPLQRKMEVYDQSTVVQTGPGRPRWQFAQIPLRWSGPVERGQRLHLYLLAPATNAVLAIARALLLAALVLRLLPVRAKRTREGGGPTRLTFAVTALALVLMPSLARADDDAVPSKAVLDELAARLLQKPACAPTCASSSRLFVDARKDRLRLRMRLDAAARTAAPLPTSALWNPSSVLVDGRPARGLLREGGKTWLLVEAGAHEVLLDGALPDRELVQLALPLRPHRVEAEAEGWRLEGLHEDGLADDTLQLARVRTGEDRGSALEPGVLPSFARVDRTLELGLDWHVTTRVTRLSPKGTAIVLEVPLLEGESVTTADVRVSAGKAQISIAPQATEVSWTSTLDPREKLALVAPRTAAWVEVWRWDASPIWHVDTAGIPAVASQGSGGTALPELRPWPGETATLSITRPAGAAGRTLTIDQSTYELRPGIRATDATLTLSIRSSRGTPHTILLPEGAELGTVTAAGKTTPQRQEGRKVTLPVAPGAQEVVLSFRIPVGMSTAFRAPPLDLGAPSVNQTTRVVMPEGRWILGLAGPRLGPVVLFWSLLAVVLAVAAAASSMRLTPLRTWQWMLLAVGLSQVHVVAAAFVVLWLHVLAWRERSPDLGVGRFNARQLLVAFMTLVSIVILIVAVQQGLLGHPDMQVRGNGSSAGTLVWFEDRAAPALAAPLVVSAPMMVYRAAMLGWALWMSLSFLAWLRWGFAAFGSGGYWRKSPPRPVPFVQGPPMPPPPPMAPPPQGPPG